MGSKNPADASIKNQHEKPNKQCNALIPNSKHKSSLKDKLSKAAHRFLGRKAQPVPITLQPATFPYFPLLPKELQLRIIAIAIKQEKGLLRTTGPRPGGGPGWWHPPDEHRLLSVNRVFRQETQRLRPKAFAFFKKSSNWKPDESDVVNVDNAFTQLNLNIAGPSICVECASAKRKRERRGKDVAAPAMMTFDFDRDWLVTSSYWLDNTLRDFDVPDLAKVKVLILAWRWEQSWSHVIPHLCRFPNIRTVGVICIDLYNHSMKRMKQGKARYMTPTGPFHYSEVEVKNTLESELVEYRALYPQVKIPKVKCMRFTRFEEGASKPPAKIYRWAKDIRDEWVLVRASL